MTPSSGTTPPTRVPVLIVDDEAPARRGLRLLLDEEPDLHVVAEARTGAEAIAAIETLRPELVFLDIQMPDGDGFDVVRAIGPERMPVVIFATAFDRYALQAFEANALDYLLKPFDRQRFGQSLDRARKQLQRRTIDERLVHLLARMDERMGYLQRILVRQGARTQFVAVSTVDYFESEANYVRVHVGERSWLVRETLGRIEEQLDPTRFLRVHRALIVHVPRIVEVESRPSGEYVLSLSTGAKLTSGRTFRAAIHEALGL